MRSRGLGWAVFWSFWAVGPSIGAAQTQPGVAPTAPAPIESTIRVVGEASVSVRPDVAELDLGVVSEGKTADAAARENARKIDRVIGGLTRALGAAADIKTVGYVVTPLFREPAAEAGPGVLDAYRATNLVRVRLKKIELAGRAIDEALRLGANDVQRVLFTVADEQAPQTEALRAAAGKARAQAEALASALGLRLVRVVSVNEEGGSPRPVMFSEAMLRGAPQTVPTPIEPGTVEVRASVTLTYELAPRTR